MSEPFRNETVGRRKADDVVLLKIQEEFKTWKEWQGRIERELFGWNGQAGYGERLRRMDEWRERLQRMEEWRHRIDESLQGLREQSRRVETFMQRAEPMLFGERDMPSLSDKIRTQENRWNTVQKVLQWFVVPLLLALVLSVGKLFFTGNPSNDHAIKVLNQRFWEAEQHRERLEAELQRLKRPSAGSGLNP